MGNKLGNMGGIVALLFDGATCQFSELPRPDDREAIRQVYNYIDNAIRKKQSHSFFLYSKNDKGTKKYPFFIYLKQNLKRNMANVCMLLGKSGTGKSTSVKTLDPKETVVINVLKKRLPFKGSTSLYNKEKMNLFEVDEYTQAISLLNSIDKNAPHVRNIIIDDMIYIMRKEYFKRAKETGYGKYTELAQHFQQIISTCEGMRDNINIFFILHSEDVQSDKVNVGFKVSTIGSLIDNQYNPVEVVPMVLYSAVKYDDKGNATYGLYTHRCMEGSVEIPAKSPADMFEEDFIPNDLGYVVQKMNEYYG